MNNRLRLVALLCVLAVLVVCLQWILAYFLARAALPYKNNLIFLSYFGGSLITAWALDRLLAKRIAR